MKFGLALILSCLSGCALYDNYAPTSDKNRAKRQAAAEDKRWAQEQAKADREACNADPSCAKRKVEEQYRHQYPVVSELTHDEYVYKFRQIVCQGDPQAFDA